MLCDTVVGVVALHCAAVPVSHVKEQYQLLTMPKVGRVWL